MNLFDRILYAPPRGQFQESVGITTHIAPKDVALYRRLLPPAFDIPARPTMTIYVIDLMKVAPWPLTRYQEWSVLLQCLYQGQEGWFPLTMPVTTWLPMTGGRHLGFPKHVTDRIVVSQQGSAITGTAIHKGAAQVELRFEAGYSRPLAAWENELADDPSFSKGGCYCLVPPGVGPHVVKLELVHVAPPKWDTQYGMVAVRVDSSATWAGLLPEDGPFPGAYNHFIGGMNMEVGRLA